MTHKRYTVEVERRLPNGDWEFGRVKVLAESEAKAKGRVERQRPEWTVIEVIAR